MQAGALGVMGNLDCESGLEANRVQGDFSPYRTASKDYTARVINGSISRDQFAKDSKGYGLAQWTYFSRKYALYDWWKKSGKALDDSQMQTEFLLHELLTDGMYSKLLPILRTSVDLYECTDQFCLIFERPAVKNIDARFLAAKRIQYEIDLNAWQDGGEEPEAASTVDHSLKLRTIDKHCENLTEFAPEFQLLNGALLCRHYVVDNTFDAVEQFQEDAGLPPDKVVGPMSWDKLLERG